LLIEEEFAEVSCGEVKDFGPVKTVFQLKPGLMLVARGDVGVQARVGGADKADETKCVGVREAGLAGLNAEFQGRVVLNPRALGEVEIFIGDIHFDF